MKNQCLSEIDMTSNMQATNGVYIVWGGTKRDDVKTGMQGTIYLDQRGDVTRFFAVARGRKRAAQGKRWHPLEASKESKCSCYSHKRRKLLLFSVFDDPKRMKRVSKFRFSDFLSTTDYIPTPSFVRRSTSSIGRGTNNSSTTKYRWHFAFLQNTLKRIFRSSSSFRLLDCTCLRALPWSSAGLVKASQ